MTEIKTEIRVCTYEKCGKDFEIPVRSNRKCCSPECSEAHKKLIALKNYYDGRAKQERLNSSVIFSARGIIQDDVHPNERGKDMSQYHGTFRIEEGKVVTR